MIRRLGLPVLLAAMACEPHQRATTSPGENRPTGLVAYLTASEPAPRTGSDVTISARLDLDGKPSAKGSFLARLTYDAHALNFVSAEAAGHGMEAVNGSQPGLVRAAGVALDAEDAGVLFRVRFHVLQSASLQSLVLSFDELNGADRVSRLRSLVVARGLSTDRK